MISAFEPIALGIGYNYHHFTTEAALGTIECKSKQLWADEQFVRNSGTGVRASTRVPSNIPLGRRLFAP